MTTSAQDGNNKTKVAYAATPNFKNMDLELSKCIVHTKAMGITKARSSHARTDTVSSL